MNKNSDKSSLISFDPFRNETVREYPVHTTKQIEAVVSKASEAFELWRYIPVKSRLKFIQDLTEELENRKEKLARLAAIEMGKPISQGRAELEKCAWLCEYYASVADDLLKTKDVKTDAKESYVSYEPLGIVLGIMPWNFPYWQVFRFIIPALISGNAVLLKHASNVQGCAAAIEEMLFASGIDDGLYANIRVPGSAVSSLIEDQRIRAISLTGSESAGASAASVAGKNIKPSLLELGGSNAFIVMPDCDLEKTIDAAIIGRFQNSGQSCIAAKRILVHEDVSDEFTKRFVSAVKSLWVGDPLDEQCYIGPLARKDLAEELHEQVEASIGKGAELLVGGRHQGAMYSPTVLNGVKPGMRAFDEETFGPVASVSTFSNLEEAIDLSNDSSFGLGVSMFTENIDEIKPHIAKFNEGAVFINSIVKSDPRLPFGGVKNSGFGRELGEEGLLAFVNRKTLYIQ